MPPMVGQVILFPYDFAPTNFSFCSGHLVPIAQNQKLFELLGKSFGGDGQTSFAIPNFDELAPANCHYCITMAGIVDGDYKGYVGETLLLPSKAEVGNVEKCDGQSLDIGKYESLFSLINFDFGGDDGSRFKLPDLSNTPPTTAYGYRITLEGISRQAFTGELLLLPSNEPIMGLHICNGEQLPVQRYADLFSLLGYRFGGDSKNQRFALPKLTAPNNYHYYIVLQGMFPTRS